MNDGMRKLIIEGYHASSTPFNATNTNATTTTSLPIPPILKTNTENPIVSAFRLAIANAFDVIKWWYEMCKWLEGEGIGTVMCGLDDDDSDDSDDGGVEVKDNNNNNKTTFFDRKATAEVSLNVATPLKQTTPVLLSQALKSIVSLFVSKLLTLRINTNNVACT